MVSFFIDEDSMRRAVLRGLRLQGIDVLTVSEAGRRGLPDEEQLRYAASEGRCVYTANVGDFTRLHNRWWIAGMHHAGIVVLPDQSTPIGVQVRALLRLSRALDGDAMRDQLEFLSGWIE